MKKTGLVWHERYMWHDLGSKAGIMSAGYPVQPGRPYENAETKRRIKNLLDGCDLATKLHNVPVREATIDELLLVHDSGYLDKLSDLNQTGGEAGLDAWLSPGGYDIARLAAGGCIEAVDAILRGTVSNAYALVRPIGHHAESDIGKGFCLLNNGALAAMHAMKNHGLTRVAFVDWDVHHGNGAQKIFWNNRNVLTISLHQELTFPPDSGGIDEIGGEDAEGSNINIPLPPGTGWGAYEAAFERVVIPALTTFQPEFIIVPSGYDAGFHDPLGRMLLYSEAYRKMTDSILDIAGKYCQGRLLVTHEGGYSEANVPFDALAVFESLSGIDSGVTDPFAEIFRNYPWQGLQPHQNAVMQKAESLLSKVPAVN